MWLDSRGGAGVRLSGEEADELRQFALSVVETDAPMALWLGSVLFGESHDVPGGEAALRSLIEEACSLGMGKAAAALERCPR
jgi:hypothetical protein